MKVQKYFCILHSWI